MIDYTQYAFADPPQVVDPIPSVADYLNDYRAQNEAWYGSWAFPMGQGQYGSRPESFDVRAPWTADLLPEEVMPTILQTDLATGEGYGGEAFGSGSTGQEDRPVGQLVADPAGMTDSELWGMYETMTGPGQQYGGMVPGMIASAVSGVPGLGFMAQAGVKDYTQRVSDEMQRRVVAALATGGGLPTQAGTLENRGFFEGSGSPTVVPDPIEYIQQGYQEAAGGGTVGPSGGQGSGGGPAGSGQDTHQGGEVGAGGWAGGGGL